MIQGLIAISPHSNLTLPFTLVCRKSYPSLIWLCKRVNRGEGVGLTLIPCFYIQRPGMPVVHFEVFCWNTTNGSIMQSFPFSICVVAVVFLRTTNTLRHVIWSWFNFEIIWISGLQFTEGEERGDSCGDFMPELPSPITQPASPSLASSLTSFFDHISQGGGGWPVSQEIYFVIYHKIWDQAIVFFYH